MRLAYLYSRYPVLSQTFCDTEMLELERRGFELLIGSIHSPLTSIRHAHAQRLKAPVHYAPPAPILKLWEVQVRKGMRWPTEMVRTHQRKYGATFKPALRARNACYFAELFQREGIQHFHVHFANRAAHTALFLKEISGIPFSVTAHGQDFMSDLGSEALLSEICEAAEFVAVETDYSRGLLSARCPAASGKIHRVYNGMNLSNFAPASMAEGSRAPIRIVSIGRLVEFKGFSHLIAACAKLKKRGFEFTCEIIGDGPLRDELQSSIAVARLDSVVTLSGALPQEAVFRKLRECDIFVLACVVDRNGASDVFPTVILEAMASSRPVVSTTLAGIPEAVVHGLTGLLTAPGDAGALTNAIERLICDEWLRFAFGNEGRARVERSFRVETTVGPLMALFERLAKARAAEEEPARLPAPAPSVGYLIDCWPDHKLPQLERELREITQWHVGVTAFVGRLNEAEPFPRDLEKLATEFVILPDEMAIEAEWQANRTLAHELEDERANQKHRAPAAEFLRQARYAVALRKLIEQQNVSHLHATSSRSLLCGVMLKKLLGVTLSATIEENPELPPAVIRAALEQCAGGRIVDRKLQADLPGSFLHQPAASKLLSRIQGALRGGESRRWQQWADLLLRWR